MAYPITVDWFENDDDRGLIAPEQSATGAGTLTGNFPYVYPGGSGFARGVAILSGGDNSGVNFTITGTSFNLTTGAITPNDTEIVAGGDATTVLSTKIYTQIDSISYNATITQASATVSGDGVAIVKLDYHRANFRVSCYIQTGATVADVHATNQLIDIPTPNGLKFNFDPSQAAYLESTDSTTGEAVTIPVILSLPITASHSVYFTYWNPSTALYFRFGNSTLSEGTYTGSAIVRVLQQGLTS